MNYKSILYVLSQVLRIEAVLLLVPVLTAIIYGEWPQLAAFLITIGLCTGASFLACPKKPERLQFYLKEGCIATALSWIGMSVFGCLPYVFTKEIPCFTDALFEIVSGFTTTGASILNNVEGLTQSGLMWRSFSHWIGGMGVLVFLLAVVSMAGGSNMNLMKAESPGPSVGKLVPKVRSTAQLLYVIYFGLTILEFLFLMAGGMPLFDSICTAFGTAGTGGFGIKNDSFGSYSAYLQWVVTIFMILFGVNFNAYYWILMKKWKKTWEMDEVKAYFLIIFASVGMITWNIYDGSVTLGHSIRDAAFQVGSIITTTGFSSVDFDLWPTLSKTILVFLMFMGACAGSTGGGMKVSRVLIMIKTFIRELHYYVYPKSVRSVKMDKKNLEEEVVRATSVYIIGYALIFFVSWFLISLEGKDLLSNFTAIAATLNNIGPGLGEVGPTMNFSLYSHFAKYVMMFDMLAGRLEIYPMVLLMYFPVWRHKRQKRK